MKLLLQRNRGGYWRSGRIALVVILAVSAVAEDAAWVAGSGSANQTGIYGTKGATAVENIPGARRESVSRVDGAGDLWLFGGWNGAGFLNDLWKFDGTNWTWVSGSNLTSQPGVYGIKGVAAPENVPGARAASVAWIDKAGNFWLFGGSGYTKSYVWGLLNDLWKFDGTNWTWVSGSSSFYPQAGIYANKRTASSKNVPGARYGSVSWIDSDGNLWLFGGWGYDLMKNAGWLNDLWEFDGTNWIWVSGSNTMNQPGVYGIQGIASPENVPGSRWGSVSWIDANDNLWLFGGVGNWGMNLNDLWKFDGTSWTWVSGSSTVNQLGLYGIQGLAAAQNVPGARDHGAAWADASGNFWLFGGWSGEGFFNDLWKYDGTYWTWIAGSDIPSQPAVLQGANSSEAMPAARWADAAWTDAKGNMWLFGGWNTSGYFDDLWNVGNYRSLNLAASSK